MYRGVACVRKCCVEGADGWRACIGVKWHDMHACKRVQRVGVHTYVRRIGMRMGRAAGGVGIVGVRACGELTCWSGSA